MAEIGSTAVATMVKKKQIFQQILKSRYFRFEECAQLESVSSDFRYLITRQCYKGYKKIDLTDMRGFAIDDNDQVNRKSVAILKKICTYCKNIEKLLGIPKLVLNDVHRCVHLISGLKKLKIMDYMVDLKITGTPLDFLERATSLTTLEIKRIPYDYNLVPETVTAEEVERRFLKRFFGSQELVNRRWTTVSAYVDSVYKKFFPDFPATYLSHCRLNTFYVMKWEKVFTGLTSFLHRCPNLNTLVLNLTFRMRDDDEPFQPDYDEKRQIIAECAKSLEGLQSLNTLSLKIGSKPGAHYLVEWPTVKAFSTSLEPELSAALIRACPRLKSLDFYGRVEDMWLNSVTTYCPNVEDVHIRMMDGAIQVSADGWKHLLSLECLKSLEIAIIPKQENCILKIFTHLSAESTVCHTLRELKLINIPMSNQGVKKMTMLKALRSLTVHGDDSTTRVDSVVNTICGTIGNQLEALDINFSRPNFVSVPLLTSIMDNCPNLTALKIYGRKGTFRPDVNAESLKRIAGKCQKLRTVEFVDEDKKFGTLSLILAFMENCPRLNKFVVYAQCFPFRVWNDEKLKRYKHRLHLTAVRPDIIDILAGVRGLNGNETEYGDRAI